MPKTPEDLVFEVLYLNQTFEAWFLVGQKWRYH